VTYTQITRGFEKLAPHFRAGPDPPNGTILWLAVLQSEFKAASIKLSSSGHSHGGRRNADERRHQRWEIGRMMVPSGL